jgi:hypothetical protein
LVLWSVAQAQFNLESEAIAVYVRCVSTRTQIYLTDDQRRRIKEVASAEGVSMAEVIRRALDGYLNEQADPDKALAATFGVARDFKVPSRDEWEPGGTD